MGFLKKKIKICNICKEEIKLDEDNYCQLIDFFKGKFYSEGYYHTQCYNNQLQNMNPEQQEMKTKAQELLSKASSLMEGVSPSEKVYDLDLKD